MRTAQLHRCAFCVDSHTELTRIAGQGEIDADDPETVRAELRAVRAFLDTTQTAGPIVADVPVSAGSRPGAGTTNPSRRRDPDP